MYRWFLSWRYLRARRTNIIGIVGIGVGVGALIMILSIMTGFLEQTKSTLRAGLADVIIEPYQIAGRDGRPASTDPKPILDAVRADPRVEAACAQLVWLGILAQTGKNAEMSTLRMSDLQSGTRAFVQIVGIDVADEMQTTELRASLERVPLRGRSRVADPADPFALPPGYTPEGRELARIIVGEQVAETWRLQRGSVIEIMTAVPDPKAEGLAASNRRFVVAGTFRSGENEVDMQRVYVERTELADFLGREREYAQVLLKLRDYPRDGKAVRDDLAASLYEKGLLAFPPEPNAGGSEVRTWEEFRRTLLGAIENERVLMAIMLSLVVLVAGFTVFAILSMMVTEKRRDIGILSALGATPGGVMQLFLFVGFWDALIGAAGGALFGTLGALYIDAIERWLSSTFGVQIFNRNVYLFDHIPSVVNPVWVGVIVLGAFVCVILFAAIPAWRAGRLHPLDALRYE